MAKRLLTQEEFEEAELEENWEGDYNPILKAQVIKLDKWWIKEVEKIITCTHVTQRVHLWEKLKQKLEVER